MLKRMTLTNNEKCTFCNTHNETIPCLFWSCNIVQHFWLMFETFVNEKCINMINMKLTEDFVLFDNAKDFESGEIFDFVILFAIFFIYKHKMEKKFLLCYVFQKQLATRRRTEEYLSYVNMEHATFQSEWLCYMSYVQNDG